MMPLRSLWLYNIRLTDMPLGNRKGAVMNGKTGKVVIVGAGAVGLALVRIATAIIRNESSVLTVSTPLNDQYGISDVCLSMPVVLDKKGVRRYICPELSADELEQLRASADAIRNVQQHVDL